jgi:hypothetical protein
MPNWHLHQNHMPVRHNLSSSSWYPLARVDREEEVVRWSQSQVVAAGRTDLGDIALEIGSGDLEERTFWLNIVI